MISDAEFLVELLTHPRTLLGRRTTDQEFLEQIKQSSSITLVPQQDELLAIQLIVNNQPKVLTPHSILSELIKKLKNDAELYLDQPVKYATVTVPAYFNDLQREYTKKAGTLAGLEILRVINEPTASGIANGIQDDLFTSEEGKVLFLHLGELGVDITVGLVEEGIYEIVSTLTSSEGGVSGRGLDDALLKHVISTYNDQNEKDISSDLGAMGKLRHEILLAEKHLSEDNSATITIQPRHDTPTFNTSITLSILTSIHETFFQSIIPTITKALKEANITEAELNALIITGEPSRVAKVSPFLSNYFENKVPIISNAPSDEAFVRGAAKIAQVFSEPLGEICCCFDINVMAVGIEVEGGVFEKIILRNHIIPINRIVNVTTIRDGQTEILVKVFQGERPLTKWNKLLGTIEVKGIEAKKAGEGTWEVVFDMDMDRRFKVQVRELGTESEKMEEVVLGEKEQIDYMMVESILVEAEEKIEEDKIAKEAVMKGLVDGEAGASLVEFDARGVRIKKYPEVLETVVSEMDVNETGKD